MKTLIHNQRSQMSRKLTGKEIEFFLMDCYGYDDDMIAQLKEDHDVRCLNVDMLSDEEEKSCREYCL